MGWQELLDDYNVKYRASTGKNIYCLCPFCGPTHTKMKMGLSLVSTAFGCWRDNSHRGMDPRRLIIALLNVTSAESEILVRKYFKHNYIKSLNQPLKKETIFEIPASFNTFTGTRPEEIQFCNYLKKRNLDPHYLASRFDLRWSISEPCEYRLVIPIKMDGYWKTWTARSINPAEGLRYLTASISKGATEPKELLFDFDELTGGETLLITEGPFDAMAITSAMLPGVSATCTFGKVLSDKQFNLILKLLTKYKRTAIAYDEDAGLDTRQLTERFSLYTDSVLPIYPSGKDWAEMSTADIKTCISKSIRGEAY